MSRSNYSDTSERATTERSNTKSPDSCESPIKLQHSVTFKDRLPVFHTSTSSSDLDPIRHGELKSRPTWRPVLKGYNRQIVFVCCLVFLPMTAFTITILSLIFRNRTYEQDCPYAALCPAHDKFNGTDPATHYIVDFPAAQLVFIASWSSTLSFTLISLVMSIYAFTAARQLLDLSESELHGKAAPTPYQMSMLIRVLNAELMALWSMGCHLIADAFWRRKQSNEGPSRRSIPILRTSVGIFITALVGSLAIQAADTYLHITTDAIALTQIQSQSPDSRYYSKGLAPWCLNRPTFGSERNYNYWSCAMDVEDGAIGAVNYTETSTLNMGISVENMLFNYVDENDSHTAFLGPKDVPADTDWQASTFGISTQCHAFRKNSCEFGEPEPAELYGPTINFTCHKDRGAQDVSGKLHAVFHQMHYEDGWHRFLKEPPPFEGTAVQRQLEDSMIDEASNLTDEEANTVVKNPWSWISAVNIYDKLAESNDTELVTFEGAPSNHGYVMMFGCNSTVYDINYTVINNQVISLERRLSNSSTTGIASIMLAEMWHLNAAYLDMVTHESNFLAKSPSEMPEVYAHAISRKFLTPFAGQIVGRPALLVQTKSSHVVTKVPKAAVWTLVVANMVFAFFGLGLTIWAMTAAKGKEKGRDVTQVFSRLGIMGLSAQLFEGEYAKREVDGEEELFEFRYGEKERLVKRIAVEKTSSGGAVFTIGERWEN